MSKLWLHTLCSCHGNYEDIFRMTESYNLFDGIVAICHNNTPLDDGVLNLLDERKGEGKILCLPFLNDFSLSRNLCLRQGIIKEGDWVLVLDTKEFVNPDFLVRLRAELIPLFEQNDVGIVYQYSKCVLFRYYRDITYYLSVHTGVRGFRGRAVDLAQSPPFDVRENWVWSERNNELSWVTGSKYYFFPDSNHTDLVYEAQRFPNNPQAKDLARQHREIRLRFFDYCREKLGFEAQQDTMIKHMSESLKWDEGFISFLRAEKILCTFYRYYVLKEDYKVIFASEDIWDIYEHLKTLK